MATTSSVAEVVQQRSNYEQAAAEGFLRDVMARDPRYQLTSKPGEPLTARVRHTGHEYLFEVRALPQGRD